MVMYFAVILMHTQRHGMYGLRKREGQEMKEPAALSSFNDHETTLAFRFRCFILLCLYCGNGWYSVFVVSVPENRREGAIDNCHTAVLW